MAFAAASPGVAAQEPVRGQVLDASTGSPVDGAEIRARSLDGTPLARDVSDARGRFTLALEPGAAVRVSLHHVAYDSTAVDVLVGDVPGEEFFEVWAQPRAVQLEGIDVRVLPRVLALSETGFYDRERRGFGKFVEPAELLERRSQPLSWFLRRRGATVRNGNVYFLRSQGLRTHTVEGCPAALLLDGRPFPGTLRDVPTEWIMGIEIYPGAAGVPIEHRHRAGCGLVLLWSRR